MTCQSNLWSSCVGNSNAVASGTCCYRRHQRSEMAAAARDKRAKPFLIWLQLMRIVHAQLGQHLKMLRPLRILHGQAAQLKKLKAHLVELKEALLLLLGTVLLRDVVTKAVVPIGIGPFEDPSALHNLRDAMLECQLGLRKVCRSLGGMLEHGQQQSMSMTSMHAQQRTQIVLGSGMSLA